MSFAFPRPDELDEDFLSSPVEAPEMSAVQKPTTTLPDVLRGNFSTDLREAVSDGHSPSASIPHKNYAGLSTAAPIDFLKNL